MTPRKYFWALRAAFFKLRFGKFGWSGYVGRPTYLENTHCAQIGKKVRIFPGLRLEVHAGGKIVIQDNVSIGQNFHIAAAKETLTVGADTTISGNVLITNIDHDYRSIGQHIMDQDILVRSTRISSNCFIGYGAVIQAGTILGKHCIVGANSVVRGEFPDKCVIAGAPARVVKIYDETTQQWAKPSGSVH